MDFDRVAPGIYRLGDHLTNFYVVDDPAGITLVDAGLPAHYDQVVNVVTEFGKTLADVKAVLLTHGHLDHVGLAERLRRETGAEVWIHEADAGMLIRGGGGWRPERSLLPYALRRPSALATPLHLARSGAAGTPSVEVAQTFRGGVLDVPGRPRAIALPGHTRGSCGYLFPRRGVIFTGDALVTHDAVVGATGPRLMCRAYTQNSRAAAASLARLSPIDAPLVLPGHGAPYLGGLAGALREARAAGVA